MGPVLLSGMFFQHGARRIKHVNQEDVRIVECCRREALEPAAEIYISLWQFFKAPVRLFNELHEDRVADFNEATAVAIGVAFGTELHIVLRAEVVENFRIRSADFSRRHFHWYACPAPPILLRAIREQMIIGDADLFPDVRRFRIRLHATLLIAGKGRYI